MDNHSIPPEKREAVTRGLHEAFGVTDFEDIRPVSTGLGSDLVFHIEVQGSPFVLRIFTQINERNDPTRQFTCMRAAAEAGLAPRVWHTDMAEGIAITDFVEAAPFRRTDALARIPGVLRSVHALPAFAKTFNYVTAHNGFIWRFRTANLLSKSEIEEVFPRYEQICAVYPRLNSDIVPCHCDLKPETMVFDGRRVWLLDWKAAMLNDRYFDLAVAANFLVTNEADEDAYLNGYFGQPAGEYQRARFLLMRQVLHMFAATIFLLLGSAGKPVDQSKDLLSFTDFHQRMWSGEVDLTEAEMKILYGRVHWRQLLKNVRRPQFEDALRIVADRHASSQDVGRLLPGAP